MTSSNKRYVRKKSGPTSNEGSVIAIIKLNLFVSKQRVLPKSFVPGTWNEGSYDEVDTVISHSNWYLVPVVDTVQQCA